MEFNFSLTAVEEAKGILNITSNEEIEIEEQMEQLCFDTRDYFLRNPVVIPLFQVRIRKLIQIVELQVALGDIELPTSTERSLSDYDERREKESDRLIDLLRWKESEMAKTRTRMASEWSALNLAHLAWDLCCIEWIYMNEYLKFTGEKVSDPENIKASDSIDTGELIRYLDQNNEKKEELIAREKRRIELILDRQKDRT